ncbi:transporter [Paraburkholderia graminis]|jgi:osmotically-inducible protein OsmY|uniref:BON domain-containing protein n=1 Tax=Paraburkholderia graminis TaxID=60548 RepID=UPI000DEF6CD4|nr:BON domain-containing protein [Paraburkholderia graminis]AXF11820.1 transporter [Paraburkholderia graminis]
MKLRHLVVSSGLALAAAAFAYTPAFAADAAAAASGSSVSASSVSPSNPAPSKKSVRAANRTFSKTVQKALFRTKGLEDTTIAVFGNAKTGHVTLAGQIESDDQEGLAVDAAKKVQGVTSVSSKLTLREQGGG